jgi:hypothetical protein
VGTGPWDLTRASTPGRNGLLASDVDRERAVDLLKAAFVQGVLAKDELDARTGAALTARTYDQLAVITAVPQTPARAPQTTAPAKRRVSKKTVAWGACAIVLASTLGAAFFTYYGGFLLMLLFLFIGAVVCSKPPAPQRPDPPG